MISKVIRYRGEMNYIIIIVIILVLAETADLKKLYNMLW